MVLGNLNENVFKESGDYLELIPSKGSETRVSLCFQLEIEGAQGKITCRLSGENLMMGITVLLHRKPAETRWTECSPLCCNNAAI